MTRTPAQQSLVERASADSQKSGLQLVREQRDVLCRVAEALGKSREDWDGHSLPGEVYLLRIHAETLAGIVQRFADFVSAQDKVSVHPAAGDEVAALLASARRWGSR